MANYRAIASGNWSNGATWAGGAVPPNGVGHDVYSNNFTVTIDTNVNVNLLTPASNAGTFVGGGTAAAGGGFTVSASALTITANITGYSQNPTSPLTYTGGAGSTLTINGNLSGFGNNSGYRAAVTATGGGTITINGNVTTLGAGGYYACGFLISAGLGIVNGNVSCVDGNGGSVLGSNGNPAVFVVTTASLTLNNGTITGGTGGLNSQTGVYSSTTGVLNFNNCIVNAGSASPAVVNGAGSVYFNTGVFTAQNGTSAISSTIVNAYGTFVYSANGTNPVGGARLILGTTPTNAYMQLARDGINASNFTRFYTADNALGQASPTDVRSGVSYASGNLTGRLTVPARGSVALSVNYGPSMPFTATRSGTTATATLAYSYPLVVGDSITVTGASNTEWNTTYTIASVVSGTSVTFTVPATHSATAGTSALMQTTGTAVLDPAAVASAVWGAATRTLTAGGGISASDVWDYATRSLTTSSGPTAVEIRTEMDANSTKLANLDATVSSRLAPSGTLAVVTTLTNAPSVPSASAIASQVRTELATELARVDVATSTRLAGSAYSAPANSDITAIKAKTDNLPASPAASGDIPSANITAIKAKTDLLNTDRLAQVSTVSTTGAQLAAALS
jgi:fibronectin-binding autotransporter adhesin